jgi:hypothetical protein
MTFLLLDNFFPLSSAKIEEKRKKEEEKNKEEEEKVDIDVVNL